MNRRFGRPRLLDLTPLLDVIMILLFGTMINSVELSKVAADQQRKETVPAEEADVLRSKVEQLEAERQALVRRHRIETSAMGDTMARLLGLSEAERSRLEEQIRALAEADPEQVEAMLDQMAGAEESAEVVRAIRRIEEMQKIFTFVDLHVDRTNFLELSSDGALIDRFSVLGQDPAAIEANIRRALESVRFSDVVLILYSYEGASLDRSVEACESAIERLMDAYRKEPSQSGRQFRYGRVGMVATPAARREG